jgi:hypothetical protein
VSAIALATTGAGASHLVAKMRSAAFFLKRRFDAGSTRSRFSMLP